MGAVMMLLGVATLAGWIGQTSPRSRLHAPRLIGISNTALGTGLLIYALQPHHLWAALIFMAAFAVGVICVVTWLVKAFARHPDDEFGGMSWLSKHRSS